MGKYVKLSADPAIVGIRTNGRTTENNKAAEYTCS
jgi:hypothetical protein